MDIVMTGYAGLSESIRLAEQYRESLLATLSPGFLERLREVPGEISAGGGEDVPGMPKGALCRIPVEEGGVFRALWYLADEMENILRRPAVGLAVELRSIPIRQETIEVCEILNKNPYQLPSGGWLFVFKEGQFLPWTETGKRIGTITEGKARCILEKEGIRYLEKPREDRIW